jgi:hypothetical protein
MYEYNYNYARNNNYNNKPEYKDERYDMYYTPCKMIYIVLFWKICKKYNLECIIPEKKYNYIKTPDDLFIKWYVNMYNIRQMDVPKYYRYKMNKFMKDDSQRFIAFPILMYDPKSIYNPTDPWTNIDNNMSHMTVVIYDKKYEYLERFDSGNNIQIYDGGMIDTVLTNIFQNMFNIKISGVNTPWLICGKHGIQALQETEIYMSCYKPILGENIGFCTMYTLWYLEKRLSCTYDIPSNIIKREINKILEYDKYKFPLTRMIKKYTYNKLQEYRNMNVHNMDLYRLINRLNKYRNR